MPTAAPFNPDSLPLRDIHLPPPVSWWPPALGWWLLVLMILLLAVGGCWSWKRRQRGRYRRVALSRLQELERQYAQENNDRQLLQALSRLLRQAALLHFPNETCAGLIGEDWLRFLDQCLGGDGFSQGAGRVLSAGPYRPQTADLDETALFALCRRWLRKLPLAPKAGGQK